MKVMFKKVTLQGLEYWICTINGREIARANSEEGVKNQVLCMIKKNEQQLKIQQELNAFMIKLT